ncbi:MAG: type III pantothenate kinase [Thermoguttaceae bacterium]
MKKYFAVDVGNSGAKFGVFNNANGAACFEMPLHVFRPDSFCADSRLSDLEAFLKDENDGNSGSSNWIIGSVSSENLEAVLTWLHNSRPNDSVTVLKNSDVPIPALVDYPEKVGIDRLLAAYGAVHWMKSSEFKETHNRERPLLVCDFGTAITIDVVSPQGEFSGGAILPGLELSSRSLNRGTSQLPAVSFDKEYSCSEKMPRYPAKNTEDAIKSGVFWSVIGAVKQFATLAHKNTNSDETEKTLPLIVLTGGAASIFLHALKEHCREYEIHLVPGLVLAGIHLCCKEKW